MCHRKLRFTRHYFQLYMECASLSFTQVLRTPVAKTILQQGTIRGLELRLSRKTITLYRQKYVSTILDTRDDLTEEQARSRLQEISKPSRSMARLLAHSDALFVKRYNEQDEQQ